MSTVNSINTNTGATIALESLDTTNSQLNAVQKQISTGYKVADATDDGAAYAVAQSVRGSVGALSAVNDQLGNVSGLVTTTNSALNDVSNQVNKLQADLTSYADAPTAGEASQYQAQYKSDFTQLKEYLNSASYNGQSLIGSSAKSLTVVQDEQGSTYGISSFTGTSFVSSLSSLSTATTTAARTALAAGGSFANQLTTIANTLNSFGATANYLTNQISYNSDKIDSLNTGLGSLVDADLAQESAQLQSLQIKQQLSEQAITIANSTPSGLVSVVKNA